MLDAIFKEDIEHAKRNKIVEFIGTNKPDDTQIILSVAETKEHKNNIYRYNNDYFNGEVKLICIGELIKERAFLSNYDGSVYGTIKMYVRGCGRFFGLDYATRPRLLL